MTKRIVFTGGGTAGHVTPNLALINPLQSEGWKVHYIGSEEGIEKEMISPLNIPYHAVKSGKLRRYFSWKNFLDPVKILYGIVQSFFLLHHLKPNVVFSKGGFVGFPVVVGAWLNRIPVIAHESDMTPGLANRLSFPFASKVCVTFEPAKYHFKQPSKVEVTGTPIREALLKGDKTKGLETCRLQADLPCLLVMGGSLGSRVINQCLRKALDNLLSFVQIIHICGKGNVDPQLNDKKGYCQFDYVRDELGDLLAASDVVLSRSGANSLYEILALKKPHILIPLSKKASRGDQIQNARYFASLGISYVIEEEQLNPECLVKAVQEVMNTKEERIHKMKQLPIHSSSEAIIELIKRTAES
ncbi:undecaprenyldiphospho-muramoylpentapeptide beta-N-acetylglucosaminyltransferase [Legionella impletisoli]|uniref:UDP-N-acetylglucosamine--N-acetylmuramyl-(pentapeptide) pyrophosphoryl-undecaprenol N-acetylglucosamine transferase n=1 Tax=Legionella impletisoli TaxID=343510 RepID=A0A917NE09_9GAMM|nr:undecaprenyldiphospho-muramoylpentapeptide beta-N-acetylglucosaminyltransferase [Legionella impletisoli]GGI91566.1 UDP-N-acetylglucosamine--N-acetylmuramyl-(pentapeptide) pyrophosphoryl-undecaprenol N-acetylglucosamine transferase [Legionella impletisoli]